MRERTYRTGPVPPGRLRRLFGWLLLIILFGVLCWFGWVYWQIKDAADHDEAQPADAIAVFGAAEYRGRPSPVLHARLDHAVALYQKQFAPLIITLGGSTDRGSGSTEGGVGRDYLLANGVPFDRILPETESLDTEQQVERLAMMAHENHLRSIIVVSDWTHMFRIRQLCRAEGLTVYTSPRAQLGNISDYEAFRRLMHEELSYTSLRLHLHVSWLHRWLETRGDD